MRIPLDLAAACRELASDRAFSPSALRALLLGRCFRPRVVRLAGECLPDIGKQIVGYAPTGTLPAYEDESRVIGQILNQNPDFAQREPTLPVRIAPPPIRVPHPHPTQIGFDRVRMLMQ
ncbi:hypothetical protein [Nocardia sp. CNY236]|uniref:hypothetical protein n=1 Tax=Nocardia sp. CNY236 TaxID=1169152 RepID=UPI00056D08FB|nr:hypothetical protein [Nocardia sp. CNY236]